METSSERSSAALKILLGGMLGMVVAMGIGRFVYTPILPLMQRDLALTNSLAGWLAGLNYCGYLAGALLCSFAPQLLRFRLLSGGALVSSIATTFCMGFTTSVFWWGGMRLLGGFASALLFIVISAEVAESLTRRGYAHWVGALYGGIGAGIALSGLAVPWLDQLGEWRGAWLGMGGVALLLAVIGFLLGHDRTVRSSAMQAVASPSERGGLRSLLLLATAYFFEGLGYIVTATFLVAIIATTPGLERFAAYSWVAVGLAAVPSTLLWPYLARRIGNRRALIAAYLLQAGGILVSIRAEHFIEVLFASVSFGGTFLGVVALTLAEGQERLPHEGRRAAAVLTACFGVGQMLGPVLAGMLADLQAGFALPLSLAAAAVFVSAVLIGFDRQSPRR